MLWLKRMSTPASRHIWTATIFTMSGETGEMELCTGQGKWPIAPPTAASRSMNSCAKPPSARWLRSEEHTSELQSRFDLVCRLLLEKNKRYKLRTYRDP